MTDPVHALDYDDIEVSLLIPEKGWLADYIRFAREHVMAPDLFHLACGLTALSAVAGASMWFPLGGRRHYATLWGVLSGPAGARKTSAINIALEMVDECVPDLRLPGDFSREALLESISEKPTGVLPIDEFGGFMARAGARDSYLAGIKQDLSQMWDSPRSSTRKTMRKTYKIERPRLTLIGACPIEDFVRAVRLGDLKQGFVSRLLFFIMKPEQQIPYVGFVEQDEGWRKEVVDELKSYAPFRENEWQIEMGDEARALWEDLDRGGQQAAVEAPAEIAGWEARRGIWAAKLGALFSLSLDEKPEMNPEELQRADLLLAAMMTRVRDVVDEIPLAGDRNAEKRTLIRERARALAKRGDGGVISQRDLFKSLWRHLDNVGELERSMEVLVRAGEFDRGKYRQPGKPGPAQIAYRVLNGLTRFPQGEWVSDTGRQRAE